MGVRDQHLSEEGEINHHEELERNHLYDRTDDNMLRSLEMGLDDHFSRSSILQLPQNKYRVKLYQLNNEGCWDDYGTGSF
jgi:hypothetical protein